MKKRNNLSEHVGKVLFSIGLGGLFAIYINWKFSNVIPAWNATIQTIASNNSLSFSNVSGLESMISLFCILSIFAALLMIFKREKSGIKISGLTFFVITDYVSILVSAVHGEVPPLMILWEWLSASYFVWICLDICEGIYHWLRKNDEKVGLNVEKLTIIWTISAFILGKIL